MPTCSHEPAEALEVVVVPAGEARRGDGGVHRAAGQRLVPGRRVVVDEVLAEPGVPAVAAVEVNLEAQAAQRPQLRHVVAQLADGVVDLHLHPLGVGLADIGGRAGPRCGTGS